MNEMNDKNLIAGLQSLLDRMQNDERTATMFEADGETLRDAIRALRHQPAASEAGAVPVPVELAARISDALGRFTGDEGWGQADMDTADEFSAMLAAPPAAAAAEPEKRAAQVTDAEILAALERHTKRDGYADGTVMVDYLAAMRELLAAPAAESAEPIKVKTFGGDTRDPSVELSDGKHVFYDHGPSIPEALRRLAARMERYEPYKPTPATPDAQGDERAVLKELVRLQDLEARLNARASEPLRSDADEDEYQKERRDYLYNWPKSWELARSALSRQLSAPASAFRECHTAIVKALAVIAKADGPEQCRERDPELIYRSPVMDEVCRIRDALDKCSAALVANPVTRNSRTTEVPQPEEKQASHLGAEPGLGGKLAAQGNSPGIPDGSDAEPDMFWDRDNTESCLMADTEADAVNELVSDCFPISVGAEFTLQRAVRLPNVTVRITAIPDDGDVQYEVVDAARAQRADKEGI